MERVHGGPDASRATRNGAVMDAYAGLLIALRREDRRKQQVSDAFADLGEVVYYIWRSPHVKIGHTMHLRRRLAELRVSPKMLLAIEPGALPVEAERHAQFNNDRIWGAGLGREHFWPSAALLAHVNALRGGLSLPPLALDLRIDR